MDAILGDISLMVFRQAVKNHLKDVSLDSRLLKVFLGLDGKKDLDTVAHSTGLNMGDMREAITRLLELELIESVVPAESFADDEFIRYLSSQFSKAIGPIAAVLIEDEVANMGCSLTRIPTSRVAELVGQLSREIRRKEKKDGFKLDMVNKMKEKGY